MDNNCNNNRLGVKLLTDAFKSEIGGLLNCFENGTTNNDNTECSKICYQIILKTCRVLLDLNCDYNPNNEARSNELKTKINSLLISRGLLKNTEQNVAAIASSVNADTNISIDTHKSIDLKKFPVGVLDRLNMEDKDNRFQKNESKIKLSNGLIDYNRGVVLIRCDASTSATLNKKLKTTNDVQNVAGTSNSIISNRVVAVNAMDVKNAHVSSKSNRKDENSTFQPMAKSTTTSLETTSSDCLVCCTRLSRSCRCVCSSKATRSGRRVRCVKSYQA